MGGDGAERGIPLLLSISQLSIGQTEIASSKVFWAIFLTSLRTFHQKSGKREKLPTLLTKLKYVYIPFSEDHVLQGAGHAPSRVRYSR